MEEDPLAGIANLFDVSIVFIVGLMVTLFSVYRMGDLLDPTSNVTMNQDQRAGRARNHCQRGHDDRGVPRERRNGRGRWRASRYGVPARRWADHLRAGG